MTTPTNKPAYVTLHRLGELSATLDMGGTPQPLFLAQRVAKLQRLPSRKAARAVNPML